MEAFPLVSVITVTYNGSKTLPRTIESVLAQTYPKIEYLIIDGASIDDTVGLAQSYAEQFAQKGYIYRIISEPDKGMYDALNKGIRLAQGKYIGQINCDDWYESDAVACAVKTFQKTGCDVCWGDVRIQRSNGSFIKKGKISRMMSSRYWNHPSTFIKVDVYKANPYALLSMYDDYELILRLYRKGYRMAVMGQTVANFAFGGMSTKKNWAETCQRIKYKCENYRRNGFGWVYYIDSVLIEMAKLILP